MIIQLRMGRSSRHSPMGLTSTSFDTRSGLVAATSAATMPPKECPTTAGARRPSESNSS